MRICIPVKTNEGLNAHVNEHFGSAPYFLIYDTQQDTFEVIGNEDSHHVHGSCHPLKVLQGRQIDSVVCRGMGARAVERLNNGGIRAYISDVDTAEEAVDRCKQGKLEELTLENCCTDHHCA